MRKSIFYILSIAALSSCADDASVPNPYLNGTEKTPIAASALLDVSGPQTRAEDMKFVEGDQLLAYLRHVTWEGGVSDARTLVEADKSPRLVTFVKGDTEVDSYPNDADITPIGTGVALGLSSTNTKQTEDLSVSGGLYWDDFSKSDNETLDLRTEKHYLQSYYGYCYNGGAPVVNDGVSTFNETDGILTWKVQADQSVSNNFKKSDLLWSAEQTPIRYNHASTSRPKLVLPYTHAMSKITVEVVCRAGFDENKAENFSGAKITLKGMATTSVLTAPTMTLTKGTDLQDIVMAKGTASDDKKTCSFSAIIAPTVIKASADDAIFAKLEDFDGNNYDLKLTDAIITTASTGFEAWNTQLTAYNASPITPSTLRSGYTAENGGLTLPGVNYHIIVTIDKQSISAKATILDWKTVSVQTEAEIILDPHASEVFNDDPDSDGKINIKTIDENRFVDNATFSLFTLKNTASSDDATDHENSAYNYATICKYANSSEDGKDSWNNDPEIYWPNATDHYYFRALAQFNSSTGTGKTEVYNISKVGNLADAEHTEDKGVSALQGTIAEGRDILWATTPLHYGKGTGDTDYTQYKKGSAVPPRTGGVPMAFEHIMTKVTFNLEDVNKDVTVPTDAEGNPVGADDPLNPHVNLEGAKIQITNLAVSGTIQIENGNITIVDSDKREKIFGVNGYIPAKLNGTDNTDPPVADDPETTDIDETTKLLKDFMVIPQTIPDDAKLIVTLANGATYSIQLNTCKVVTGRNTDGTPIYGSTPIGEWKRGENYTYTILLEKEKMEFRVMIKKWDDPEEGGGKATLDWD